MLPWLERPTIDFDLDKPMRRRFEGVPKEAYADGRLLLETVMREVPAKARFLAYWFRLRTLGRFHREAVSLAREGNVDWRELMLANVIYDLAAVAFGCSTVALPTPSGPVLARNMDWWAEDVLARTSYLLRYFQKGALHFASAGWPGSIGVVSGLSGRGFAVVLNAVPSPEGIRKTGYPVLLHLRRVIEDAADFEAALAMLARQRLTAAALFTLVGSRNEQRVVIERTPTRHALRWASRDEPLIATNDYRLLFKPESHQGTQNYETTCSRYDALCRFFENHHGSKEVEDATLLYILSDPSVMQDITAQHIIMRPRQGTIRLYVPRRLVEENGLGLFASHDTYPRLGA
jgi:hypothetical protein